MRDTPTVTRHDDGTLTVEWPDPPRPTYEVAAEVLEMFVADHNALTRRVAELEHALDRAGPLDAA